MVGLTLGLALAQGGLNTVIADAAAAASAAGPQIRRPGFGPGLCQRADADGAGGVGCSWHPDAQPIREILVTDGKAGPGRLALLAAFRCPGSGRRCPGPYRREPAYPRRAVCGGGARSRTSTLIAPAAVKAVTVDGGRRDGDAGAMAKRSPPRWRSPPMAATRRCAAQMGIDVIGWSYPQTGIVATVEHEKPHNGVAYEHFLPSGPFAILPMTGKRTGSSLVWTEAKTKAPGAAGAGRGGLQCRTGAPLRRSSGRDASRRGRAGPIRLSFHLARDFVRPRFALAGDCAHGIHPIAGQGLNLGLKDAAALAEVLLDAARLGRDIGALDTLKRYERWRRFDSFALAASHRCAQPPLLQRHRAAAASARSGAGHRGRDRPGAAILHAPCGRRCREVAAVDERRSGVSSRLPFASWVRRACSRASSPLRATLLPTPQNPTRQQDQDHDASANRTAVRGLFPDSA